MVENPIINYMEVEPRVVSRCQRCDEDFTEQDEFLAFEEEHFCDESCLHSYYDVKTIRGSELL